MKETSQVLKKDSAIFDTEAADVALVETPPKQLVPTSATISEATCATEAFSPGTEIRDVLDNDNSDDDGIDMEAIRAKVKKQMDS